MIGVVLKVLKTLEKFWKMLKSLEKKILAVYD